LDFRKVAAQNDEVFYKHTRGYEVLWNGSSSVTQTFWKTTALKQSMRDKDQKQNSFEKSEKNVRTWADLKSVGYHLLHLQNFLVGQIADPELHAQAAREYTHFCEDGPNLYFWDAQTEAGDSPEGHGNDDDEERHFSEEGEEEWKLNVKMKKKKNGWKDLNLQTADSDDTRNQAKMKFPILKSGLISIFLKIENG
jgi:hypothetical protein